MTNEQIARLMNIQNIATFLLAVLDSLQDEAAGIVNDEGLALDFVYGIVGLIEVSSELDKAPRTDWRTIPPQVTGET